MASLAIKIIHKRLLQGAAVSVLLPAGWWALSHFLVLDSKPLHQFQGILYTYLFLSSCILLVTSAYVLGKKESYIKTLALYDNLTGIYNAQYFEARLKEEIKKNRREGGSLAIISFDLDHYKRVIDSHGEEVGQEVLRVIAQCVSSHLRQHDVFARVGSEAFSILLPNCNLQSAEEKAEQLRRCISNTRVPLCERKSLVTTASFGVTQYHQSENEELFVSRADSAIIDAKYAGRNNTKVRVVEKDVSLT